MDLFHKRPGKLPVPERVGALVLNAEYYHSDSYLGQDLTIPSYHVVNAKLDWNKALGSPIDVSLYVRNLFDKDYIVAPGVATEGLGYFSAVYADPRTRSEEHTSELQSLMRISYAVFCLKKKKTQ